MPRGRKSGGCGGGHYVSGGYMTSTGRLYSSKPGPKSGSSKNTYSSGSNKGGGHYTDSAYITSTGRVFKSKPGPKSSYPTENDNYTFSGGYITSTGRYYKSKPGPKSNCNYTDSRSFTNILDNMAISDNYYQYNDEYQEPIRIRPHNEQINFYYNYNRINSNNNDYIFQNRNDFEDDNDRGRQEQRRIIDRISNFFDNDYYNYPKKENEEDKIKKYKLKVEIVPEIIKEEDEKEENSEKEEKNSNKKEKDDDDFCNKIYQKKSDIKKLKKNLSPDKKKNTENKCYFENKIKNGECSYSLKMSDNQSMSNVCVGYNTKCLICMSHFKSKEKIGKLKCDHSYHLVCILRWFEKGNVKCPICNNIQF